MSDPFPYNGSPSRTRAGHKVARVHYLGGFVSCTCGWHLRDLTLDHARLAAAFTDHRRAVGAGHGHGLR